MLDQITFDQLPSAVATILDDLAELKEICNDIRGRSDSEAYLTIEELQAYHPDHPSRTTIHRWKRDGYLPFYRDPVTRRTKFKKSENDALIEASRHMTRQLLSVSNTTGMTAGPLLLKPILTIIRFL